MNELQINNIEKKIYEIRWKQVMLDREMAVAKCRRKDAGYE